MSAAVIEAQTSQTQGYPQIGPPTYSYSALYLDASQFCTNGFNFTAHACNTGGNMWQAIASAASSSLNVSGVIDARAFQGQQLIPYGVATTALFGGATVGASTVNGALLLGEVMNYCEGSSTVAYFVDGNGSRYGTPCIIVPWGFQIIGTAPLAANFLPCNGSPCPAGTNFPQRSFPISSISVSGTTMTVTVSGTLTTSGGPTANQNIYPGTTDTGELVAITGAPTGYNFLRTVVSASQPNSQFTIAVPSSTTGGQICGSPAPSCGSATAYLVTPLIGYGYQNNSTGNCAGTGTTTCAYEPVHVGTNQSFNTRLINLAFDLQSYVGAVAVQNLNGGEQSGMDTIYCKHPSMGCVQVSNGASESGPYNNIYVQSAGVSTAVYPSTFGIYNGSAGAGFHRFTMTAQSTLGNQPTAAIYDDGPNVVFDGEPHNEGTSDTIDVAANGPVYGLKISGVVGPPSANSGTNLVHILNDGSTYTVSGSTISNLTQQTSGSVNAIADDIHSNNVTDPSLPRYEFDSSGNPVSGATSQSNSGITTINGSGLTAGGPASSTNGSLTLNGSTSGSAAITVSSTGGTLALPSGTTATNMVLTTPNLGTPSTAILTNATGLPLGSGLTATFSSPLSLSTNTLSCPTCVTSSSALTNTAIMTGAGSQGSQTPSASATLSSGGSMSLPGTITSGSNSGTGGSLTLNGSSSGSASVSASGSGSNLQLNSTSTFVDTNGSLTVGRHLNQNAANTFAGSCSMSSGTTCTFTITASFTGTPLTFVSQDGSVTLAQIAAKCSVSGTTVTVTAFTSNSLKWDCLLVGNPN